MMLFVFYIVFFRVANSTVKATHRVREWELLRLERAAGGSRFVLLQSTDKRLPEMTPPASVGVMISNCDIGNPRSSPIGSRHRQSTRWEILAGVFKLFGDILYPELIF